VSEGDRAAGAAGGGEGSAGDGGRGGVAEGAGGGGKKGDDTSASELRYNEPCVLFVWPRRR
jgi:hypothetical protein